MQTINFTFNSLLILTWNSNDLIHHRNELLATLQNSIIDIALISEIHLTNVTQINIPGYHIIKSNHSDGTAMLVPLFLLDSHYYKISTSSVPNIPYTSLRNCCNIKQHPDQYLRHLQSSPSLYNNNYLPALF